MEGTIIAAIIAASIAALTSVVNICLTVHRNKQDGIIAYRMKWIDDVRNEFSNIFGWTWYTQDSSGKFILHPLDELRKSVHKVALYLNIKDDYDYKVLEKTFEYLNSAQKTYETFFMGQSIDDATFKFFMAQQSSNAFEESEKIKKELQKLVRVYLKTEWTRVKAESSIIKTKYAFCWKTFKGFQADQAIEKFLKEYKD